MEEVAGGDFNVGYVQLLASLVGGMLVRHAAEALVAEWVPRIVAGTAIVGLALTEPRGGSDAANLVLRAERRGENFVLNGEKNSISFADQADAFVVFARTGVSGGGAHGVSAFFVPADSPGLGRTRLNCIGSKLIGRGSLFFDDAGCCSEHDGRENAGLSVACRFRLQPSADRTAMRGRGAGIAGSRRRLYAATPGVWGPDRAVSGRNVLPLQGDTIIAAARQLATIPYRFATPVPHTRPRRQCASGSHRSRPLT